MEPEIVMVRYFEKSFNKIFFLNVNLAFAKYESTTQKLKATRFDNKSVNPWAW